MQTISAGLQTALAQPGLKPRTQIMMHLSNNRAYTPTVNVSKDSNKLAIVDSVYEPSMKFAFIDDSICDDFYRVFGMDEKDTQIPWVGDTAPTTIEVIYPNAVNTNKILVTTDFVHPATSLTIAIRPFGGSYANIVTSFNPNGYKTALYLQPGGTWSTTVDLTQMKSIDAVKVTINSVEGGSLPLVYEVDAAIEVDVSSYIKSWTVTKQRDLSGEMISPIGLSAANASTIVIENSDNTFNNYYPLSPYYRLLLPNARFHVRLGFELADTSVEYVEQGLYLADSFELSNDTSEVNVSCRDYSKVLQEKICPGLFYRGILIDDIVRDIVERAGFRNLDIDTTIYGVTDLAEGEDGDFTDIETLVCVPRKNIVWSEKGETYWSFLQDIALTDLGVFYFDESGKFIFKVKESLTDGARADAQTVMALTDTLHIKGASYSTELLKNAFKITYIVAKPSLKGAGLWEADDPTTLSYVTLSAGINSTQDTITPSQSLSLWPETGFLRIENEVVEYKDRSNTQFKQCLRGQINTRAVSHAGGVSMREMRHYNPDWAVIPTTDISYYFTNKSMKVVHFSYTPVGGDFYIQNTVDKLIIIEGTHVEKAVDGLPEFFGVYGKTIDQTDSRTLDRIDEASVRRYGRQDLELNFKWVQSQKHAKGILEFLVAAYSQPVIFVNVDTFALPHLQLGDVISLQWDRLGLDNRHFHIVEETVGMDGNGDVQNILKLRLKIGASEVSL